MFNFPKVIALSIFNDGEWEPWLLEGVIGTSSPWLLEWIQGTPWNWHPMGYLTGTHPGGGGGGGGGGSGGWFVPFASTLCSSVVCIPFLTLARFARGPDTKT